MSLTGGSKFILTGGVSQYQIARSLRFRSSSSAYLSRTPGSTGTPTTWVMSGWFKLGAIDTGTYVLFSAGTSTSNYTRLILVGNVLEFINVIGGTSIGFGNYDTSALFRDPSAWYHIIFGYDSTQSVAANRIFFIVNGVQQAWTNTQTTGASATSNMMTSASPMYFGRQAYSAANFYEGYLAEAKVTDGYPSNVASGTWNAANIAAQFGQFDATTGAWTPKAYSGTYGTNGFYLPFSDNSAATSTTIGKDSSGNGNNFTPSGISITAGVTNDSLVDTPTNYGSDTGAGGEVRGNYATLSPLANGATLSDGNLKFTWASASWASARATQPLFDGAYVECEGVSGLNSNFGISRGDDNAVLSTTCGFTVTSVSYLNDGKVYKNTADLGIASTSTWSTTDKVCLYFKNGAVWFGKLSGSTITWQLNGAASQAAIVAEMIAGTTTHAAASGLTGDYFVTPSGSGSGSTASYYINFGQRAWVGVTNFPTGAKALCTQNLPDPAIPKPSSYFDVATITGTGAAINIPQAVQSPDLYFLKDRSGVSNWQIGDTSRTNGNNLHSNSTAAGVSNPSAYFSGTTIGMQPYDADGGQNAHAYVAAQWKKGATPGIDIVTWTGNGTSGNPGRSVSHGLGVKPAMIIGKRTDSTSDWGVWHKSFSNDVYYLKLNSTAAQFTGGTTSSPFGGGGPYFSSTVFYVSDNADTLNVNSGTYVGYVFAEIAGFSKFGSYTGNGSADGPFVFTNMLPRYILIKRTDSTSDWYIWDTARDTYNVESATLLADTSGAETSAASIDGLSNGFKCRSSTVVNASGGTYIYAAFASSPFKYSRAR